MLILITIFSLYGCTKDKTNEVITVNYHPKQLVIPSDLAKNKIDDYYPIPDVKKSSTNVSLIPPGSKGIKK